jgi:dihydroorotase
MCLAPGILRRISSTATRRIFWTPTARCAAKYGRRVPRGVVLDVAHAGVHCDFRIARAAIDQGLIPTTISTDVHVPPPERTVYQMPDLISTSIAMGMTLEDAVAASTICGAEAIGREREFDSRHPGMAAAIAVFSQEE